MSLKKACSTILEQLGGVVEQMQDADFTKPSKALSGSSIGQHLRHTLEFFICFEKGFSSGLINYDKRAHDKLIESDREIARAALSSIQNFINHLQTDKALKLEVSYERDVDEFTSIETTAFRELVYNIEHAVHHMAIMKIGIREVAPYVILSPEFGVASSTIRYKEVLSSYSHH